MLLNGNQVSYFRDLAARRGSLRLVNTYHGIPVIHSAVIQSFEHKKAIFEVHPRQAVCLKYEGKTYLIPENGAQPLEARCKSVSMLHNRVELAIIGLASGSVGKRLAVRVQPETPIEVLLDSGEKQMIGKLTDLSASGMGISELNTHVYGSVTWGVGQEVWVELRLPLSEEDLRLRGTLTNLTSLEGAAVKNIGIAFTVEGQTREMLQRYISQRQTEMLEQLDREYEELCRWESRGLG
jgi:hypothetical protein